jgi:topoisomerase IA-like protein
MTTEKIFIQVGNEKLELTGGEKLQFIEQRKQDKLLADKIKADEEAEATAKAESKAALLARLGITAEEAALLLA